MKTDNLDKWRERLNASDLPVFARTVRKVGEVATSQRSSAQDLSEVIGHDASMAARLIRIANSPMFNVQNRSIETISNAVVLIGFDSVRDLAVSISIVEEVLKGNRHARVGQLMAHAFHAAAHAKSFAVHNKVDHAEEIFVAALLKQVGEMAFWSRAGAETTQIESRVADGASLPCAEQEVLGFCLDALSRALADDWSLGDLARKVHDRSQEDDGMVACVKAAHELAELLENEEWTSPAVEGRLTELANSWNLSTADVRALVQQNMKDAAEIAQRFGVPKRQASDNGSSAPATEPVRQPKRSQDASAEIRYLREIADGLENEASRDALMQLIVDGVVAGIGCSRAYFLLLSADRSKLVAKYVAGACPEGLVGQSRAVKQPGPLADILENKRVVAGVPVSRTDPWHGDGSALMATVRINNRPIGVLYGEVEQNTVEQDRQASFRQFAQQLSLVLMQTG